MEKINVTIYNEYLHELSEEKIAKVYPKGIHGAIIEMLEKRNPGKYNFRVANFNMPSHGLTDDVIENTDVLIWWGHMAHNEVDDEVVEKIVKKVWEKGLGLIVLHSAHYSKPFRRLMGTSCRLKWRESDDRERLWIMDPAHPITKGIPESIELPHEETYGERFEIPAPDQLIMMGWFEGGEVFRSGCCYHRGLGKIFYLQPGHESYPTYYNEDIIHIIDNAIDWAKFSGGPTPNYGNFKSLEEKYK